MGMAVTPSIVPGCGAAASKTPVMKTNKPPGGTQAANQSRGLTNKPSGETQMAN